MILQHTMNMCTALCKNDLTAQRKRHRVYSNVLILLTDDDDIKDNYRFACWNFNVT
jgi:hypothetical protein